MENYSQMTPREVREKIRKGEINRPTAGMCAGYAQANLVILPKKYAEDFKEFARKNPKPCPILEIIEGSPMVHAMGEGANLVTDIPKYFIYKNGVKVDEVTDASSYWEDDFVGFLIGCSFSFEEALLKAGIEVRHIAQGCNVPMFKTNIPCAPAGVFNGPVVASMRPMTPENAQIAKEITDRFPNVHGGPIQIGHPEDVGVFDINKPDYGDSVEVREGEIPVFWACGVTPQAAVENAKPPIVITHAPGYMFITDVKNEELNDYLEERLAKPTI
ncbi:MAG: putative hydro-lyase [Clostridium sp.]